MLCLEQSQAPFMHETWKPVPGYEGLYEVSDMGRVKSLGRPYKMRNSRQPEVVMDCKKPERILKTTKPKYPQVALYATDGTKTQPLVHHLVLRAFVGEAPAGMEGNHKNGDSADNRLENLEWVTHQENIVHSRHTLDKCVREKNGNAKLTEQQVIQLRQARVSGQSVSALAREFGVSVTAACNAATGRTWKTLEMAA